MKSIKQLLKLVVSIALIAVISLVTEGAGRARQTEFVERTLNFSSIGLTRGQIVRVTGLAVGPCNIPVEILFLDKAGRVLKRTTQEVETERFVYFDLNFDSLGRLESTIQLRALVRFAVHAEHLDQEDIVATLEVMDSNSERTGFSWGARGYRTGAGSERTLNFGSIGITKGQTARINALVVGASSVPVELVFLDQDGAVLKASTFMIAPESIDSVELNFDELARSDSLSRQGSRLQLRALVKFISTDQHQLDVIPNLEILDNRTSKTTFVLSVPEPPEVPAVQR